VPSVEERHTECACYMESYPMPEPDDKPPPEPPPPDITDEEWIAASQSCCGLNCRADLDVSPRSRTMQSHDGPTRGAAMVIQLDPNLEAALNESARRRGSTPEAVAIDILREQLLNTSGAVTPQDDWERRLLGAATDCGVSLPAEALTSDGMYE